MVTMIFFKLKMLLIKDFFLIDKILLLKIKTYNLYTLKI